MASNLMNSGLRNIEVESFVKAFTEVINNESTSMSPEEANQTLQEYFSKQQEEMLNKNLETGIAFLEENSKKDNVVSLPSGLQYEILTEGNGPKPKATESVKCHYHGTLLDGTVFDSSIERNEPIVFGVTQVIAGWTEALKLMPVGSKWKLYVPYNLAYGAEDRGTIPPFSTLIFDVELISIEN